MRIHIRIAACSHHNKDPTNFSLMSQAIASFAPHRLVTDGISHCDVRLIYST
jgi:hypothetical protein